MQTNQKKRIAVLCSGGGSNLQALIDAEKDNQFNGNIVLVIVSNHNAYALERANQNDIQTAVFPLAAFPSGEQRDLHLTMLLNQHNIDLVVLAGYLGILTPVFFESFNNPIINIHPSLLPKFGGAGMHGMAVHKAVIETNEKISGATVHYVDSGIDTGKIIMQDSLEVLNSDTPETLQQRILHEIEHKLIVKAVTKLCNE